MNQKTTQQIYPELPMVTAMHAFDGVTACWPGSEMRTYADETCEARGTAQATPTETHVIAITVAYEQGVGKGQQAHHTGSEIANPYDNAWNCDYAWNLGYKEGKLQAGQVIRCEEKLQPGWCDGCSPDNCSGCATSASQPVAVPAGLEPVYQIGQPFLFDPENTWRDASKDAYDVCMTNRRRIIYTAAQVQAMLAAGLAPGWRAVPVEPTSVQLERVWEFGYDEAADVYRAMIAAAPKPLAPSAPAHKPLTEEQIDEIHLANSDAYERGDVEYESHGFARAIEQAHGIKATNQESNK